MSTFSWVVDIWKTYWLRYISIIHLKYLEDTLQEGNCFCKKNMQMVGDNKHKMGYIKDDGTLTDVTFAYYDWLSIDPLKEPDCSDCKYLPICGGGCRMLSYRQTGTYHAAGCEKVKGVIEKQIEVYVRRQVQFQNN